MQNSAGTRSRLQSRLLWTAVGVFWLAGVVAGLGVLANYDNTPGVAAHAPAQWPAGSRLTRDTAGPTLVMLAHPRCVCTRASLGELAELLARAHQRPKTYVVFIKPGGVGEDWNTPELWQIASRIPGVTVVRDDNGIETQRFGAVTSGQTLLYGASGQLIFGGGTTGSRGHPGDNAGRAAILTLLNGDDPHRAASPVFGCPLFSHDDASRSN